MCIGDVFVLVDNMALTPEKESGCEQPFNPNRAPCMNSAGTDANLRPQTESVAITEPGGCIVVDTSCIYLPQE